MPEKPKSQVPTPPPSDPYAALRKASSIAPDKYAQFFTDHPWIAKALGFVSPGVDPHNEFGVTDVMSAGIPFAAPLGKVFHGTPNVFESFSPAERNISDTMGSYLHFAERPEYSDQFTSKFGRQMSKPNVIPATLDVKNALDLHSPNIDVKDLDRIIAALPQGSVDRNTLIRNRKHLINPNPQIGGDAAHVDYMKDVVMGALRANPDALERAGFDGVKYTDIGEPAWAVPNAIGVKTPWGLPMSKPSETTTMQAGPQGIIPVPPVQKVKPQILVGGGEASYGKAPSIHTPPAGKGSDLYKKLSANHVASFNLPGQNLVEDFSSGGGAEPITMYNTETGKPYAHFQTMPDAEAHIQKYPQRMKDMDYMPYSAYISGSDKGYRIKPSSGTGGF